MYERTHIGVRKKIDGLSGDAAIIQPVQTRRADKPAGWLTGCLPHFRDK